MIYIYIINLIQKTFPEYNGDPGDPIEAQIFIADKFITAGKQYR